MQRSILVKKIQNEWKFTVSSFKELCLIKIILEDFFNYNY